MTSFDIAIVGGGPAGSSTALHVLARRPELRVALLEKKRMPREKYCAGAISAWGLAVLAKLGLRDLAQGVAIRAVAVRVGDHVGRVERDGLGVVVRRSVFDRALFEAARSRGADARDGCAVSEIVREGDGWRLETAQGTVRAKLLVGADGASGFARRALGLGEPRRRAHLYLCETLGAETRDRVSDGTVLFDLTPAADGSVEGYYWDFAAPLDGTPGTSRGIFHLNARALDRADALKSALARSLAARDVRIDDVELKPHSIRPVALGVRASVPRALLAGEAVGVDPVTGEGIAHALAYGSLAAEAIVHALRTGDVRFADWHRRIERSFVGRHLRDACRLATHVYGPHAARYATFLARTPDAMAMGARWYLGERVGRIEKLAMFAKLATGFVRSAS